MVRSEKTRKFIIEKTAAIFNRKGYTGTYMSDLTQATGLTKGSIYGNFKDKNEVAVEAFRYNYRFQTANVIQEMEQEAHAGQKLLRFLNHYKTAYAAIFNNGGCAILNTAVDTDDGNDLLKQEVIKTLHQWHKIISETLMQGIEKKQLRPTEVDEFTYRMVALIEGSILLSKTLNKPSILIKNIEFLETEVHALFGN